MPPQLLFPLDGFDLDKISIPVEEIHKINAQRFEMEQLDGIIAMNAAEGWSLGVKKVRQDEFWVRGHVPGRPIMPGVVMLECAAQLSSFLVMNRLGLTAGQAFMGFAGMNHVRFRGTVVPGDRLVLLCKNIEARARYSVSRCQGIVGDKVVFECEMMGMIV